MPTASSAARNNTQFCASGEATKPPTRGATPDITHIAIGVANRYARMVTALRNKPVLKPVVTATANTAQTAMSKLFMAVVPRGAELFKLSVSMRAHDRALAMSDLFDICKEIILVSGASQGVAHSFACILYLNILKVVHVDQQPTASSELRTQRARPAMPRAQLL